MSVKVVITLSLALLVSAGSLAQEHSLGLFNSPKGFGLSYTGSGSDGSLNTVNIFADMQGVISGKYTCPGVRADYCHGIILKTRETEWGNCQLYAGPGVSGGYVRDYGSDNFGILFALYGAAGARFNFTRGISIDLNFGADLGLWVEQRRSQGENNALKIYRNGLFRLPYPQLKIDYRF